MQEGPKHLVIRVQISIPPFTFRRDMMNIFDSAVVEFVKNPLSFLSLVVVVLTALFFYFGQARYIAHGVKRKEEIATREILVDGARDFIKFFIIPALLALVLLSITTITPQQVWQLIPLFILVLVGSWFIERLFGKEDARVFAHKSLQRPFQIVGVCSTLAFIVAFLVLQVDDYTLYSIFIKTLTTISLLWFLRSLLVWAYTKEKR